MMINDYDDEPESSRPFPFAGVIICIAIVAASLLWPLFLRAGVREQLYVAEAEARSQAANRRDLPNDFDSNEPAGSAQVASPSPIEMTVYTMDGCVPCQQMLRLVGNGNERIKLTWSKDQPPDGVPQLRPVTVWTSPQGRVTYRVGSSSLADLVRCYESDLPQAAAVGAAPLRIRPQIVDGLAKFRQYVGDSVSITWDRTGKQSFDLLHAGTDWSVESLFGQSGRMEIAASSSMLLVKQAGFGYRVQGDDVAVDLDPIILTGLARRLGPQASAVGSDPAKMDPMTVLTILQVIRGIWLAMHPTCDLELGGNVACVLTLSGDVLTVKFSECPRLRITAYWQWLLGVDTVIVSPDKIRVEFVNQPGVMFPIKSREWAVTE